MDLDNFPTNETGKRMLDTVSNGFYDNSYVGKWLFQIMGAEMEEARKLYEELPYQAFVETATWGLRYHEEKYGLAVREDLSDEERRRRIYQKRKSKGAITPYKMEQIIELLSGSQVSVVENEKPNTLSVYLLLDSVANQDQKVRDIIQKIDNIKQSHVSYEVIAEAPVTGTIMFGSHLQEASILMIRQVK